MDCQTQKTVLQTGSGLRGRNEAIECCRLLCAVLVVFIHCRFPGFLGEGINCLAKVAVPFFFVVSGYFAWQVREKTLRKRFWSVVKLNFSAHLLYILWDSYQADVRGLSELVLWCLDKCSAYALSILLLLSKSPFRSHLWYLNAVILPYILVWLYVRWQEKEVCDYRPLYLVGVCLYILHVVLGSLASACGLDIPYHIYRNGLLFGLPMFILGLFLGEHHDRIIRIYRLSGNKLMGLIVLGAFLSLLQWKGTGPVEMPVGAVIEVIAIVLLAGTMPVLSKGSPFLAGAISTFGTLSTYIYVTHMIWNDVYALYLRNYVLDLGETAERLLYPLLIAGISLITGILYMGMKTELKTFWRKGKQTR